MPLDTVPVKGRAPGATTVLVNGRAATLAADGSFALELPLATRELDVVVAASAPNSLPAEARAHVTSKLPRWLIELHEPERPRFPLPQGIEPGAKPRDYVNAADGSTLVYVPAGSFLMGSTAELPEYSSAPVHRVALSSYFLGKCEVTNAQFAAFVKATGYRTSAEERGEGTAVGATTGDWETRRGISWRDPFGEGPPLENHPVVLVSWLDATAYCAWAKLRLPTEAEWERAAIWDSKLERQRRYAWGDELLAGHPVANLADKALVRRYPVRARTIFFGYEDGFERTAPVGAFADGASPVGALDMTGNVREWCQDAFDKDFYARSPSQDPVCPPEGRKSRVTRGGAWAEFPNYTPGAVRSQNPVNDATVGLGFRVAR